MKNYLFKSTLLLVLSVFTLGSCVDNDYDLTNINTDNLVIGTGGFVVPLGDIEIDLAQFIGDNSNASLSKAPKSYEFKPYNEQFDIDAGFDDGLVDQLTEYGEITLNATISNVGVFDFGLNVKVEFVDAKDVKISLVDDKNISTASGTVSLSSKILNKEVLTQVANSKQIRLTIEPNDGLSKTFMYDVEQVQKVNIRLSIRKTGGLKL